ncbi:unnamed protein product, partial [Linum tenue]
ETKTRHDFQSHGSVLSTANTSFLGLLPFIVNPPIETKQSGGCCNKEPPPIRHPFGSVSLHIHSLNAVSTSANCDWF